MVLQIILIIGGLAILFGLSTRIGSGINNSIEGANEFGGKIQDAIFPDPEEQKRRDDNGAICNTFDTLAGRGSCDYLRSLFPTAPATAPAAAPEPSRIMNTKTTNKRTRFRQ